VLDSWHQKTIQDNPWNKQDQHSQQKQDDTWMTDDPSNISHLTLTMKNTSDTLPKTKKTAITDVPLLS